MFDHYSKEHMSKLDNTIEIQAKLLLAQGLWRRSKTYIRKHFALHLLAGQSQTVEVGGRQGRDNAIEQLAGQGSKAYVLELDIAGHGGGWQRISSVEVAEVGGAVLSARIRGRPRCEKPTIPM